MKSPIDNIEQDIKNIGTIGFRKIWEPFMKKHNCDTICELGIYKGDNFMQMIEHAPKLAIAVDSWKDDGIRPKKYDIYTQDEFDQQYKFFKNRVSDKPFVEIIRDTTSSAVKKFEDNYFDLVYIDADHAFEGCYKDLVEWYPKIKPGKFLMGHDYSSRLRRSFGVFDAVNKFALENNLEVIRFGHSNWAVIKK